MNHDGMHWWAAINGLCHLELLLQLDMATPRAVADAYVFSTTFSLVVTLTFDLKIESVRLCLQIH